MANRNFQQGFLITTGYRERELDNNNQTQATNIAHAKPRIAAIFCFSRPVRAVMWIVGCVPRTAIIGAWNAPYMIIVAQK